MFCNCTQLSEVQISVPYNFIGASCFENCDKLKLTIAPTCHLIRDKAFMNGPIFQDIDISQIDSIGSYSFMHSKIQRVTFSSRLTYIGNYAFADTNLEEVEIPDSVTIIGDGAFEDCTKLSKVKLSKKLVSISSRLFINTALTTIEIPKSVTNVWKNFFPREKDFNITFEGGSHPLFSIDGNAFVLTAAKKLLFTFGNLPEIYSIPNGIISIESNAIYGPAVYDAERIYPRKLRAAVIKIPESVMDINSNAFGDVDFLFTVCYNGTTPQYQNVKYNETFMQMGVEMPKTQAKFNVYVNERYPGKEAFLSTPNVGLCDESLPQITHCGVSLGLSTEGEPGKDKSALSGADIAFIVIGVLLMCTVAGLLCLYFFYLKDKMD